ncbi:hypothetical protein V1478_001207 [Vespula squamosa]|uniref:Uncharacterized protein n=1 Tax=Vespula squamosa TaxID=30214 RepID=A0ABD2C7P2_VESSQ
MLRDSTTITSSGSFLSRRSPSTKISRKGTSRENRTAYVRRSTSEPKILNRHFEGSNCESGARFSIELEESKEPRCYLRSSIFIADGKGPLKERSLVALAKPLAYFPLVASSGRTSYASRARDKVRDTGTGIEPVRVGRAGETESTVSHIRDALLLRSEPFERPVGFFNPLSTTTSTAHATSQRRRANN